MDDPDENLTEVMDTLIPPLEASAEIPAAKTPEAEASVTDTAKSDDSIETHYKMLLEQELRTQREEEKYAMHIGILSIKEESVTETDSDDNAYSCFN